MAVRRRTDAYWEKRSIQRMAEAERLSLPHLRSIVKMYDDAQRNTVNSVRSLYDAYYKDKGWDRTELAKIVTDRDIQRFMLDMKERGLDIALPDNYRGRLSRLELLNAQMDAEVDRIKRRQVITQTRSHRQTINHGFYRAAYDVSRGIGMTPGFNRLNTTTVNAILNTKFMGANYKERIWKNTDILAGELKNRLAAAIATGQSPDKTVREIRDRFSVKKHEAARLVRTETNYFENYAEVQSYAEMGFEELVFMATLDGRTSFTCQQHDGKRIKLAEAIQGYNVPPLHPYCRSCVRPYIGKEYEPETRISKDPRTGRYEYVTNMTYSEWADSINLGKSYAELPISATLGAANFDAMSSMIANATPQVKDAWDMHADDLRVNDPNYHGKSAHYSPTNGGVYMNIESIARGNKYSAPYETAFHELFHNIDYLASSTKGGTFSTGYGNGAFTKLLRQEAEELITRYRVSGGESISRAKAIDKLKAELKRIPSEHRGAISDILHGATNRKVHGDIGHFSKGYWERPGAVAKESFANMAGADIANPEAVAHIKKYMPKSYTMYREMISQIGGGAK